MSQVRQVRKKSKNSRSGKVKENACKVSKIFYFYPNILKTDLWLWLRRRVDKQRHWYSQTFSELRRANHRKNDRIWSGKVRKFRK